ncbi:YbbR-like domain-containing protein [Seonamhaeicola marinus]|uniref:YbbR-like domain-containing protein n=1 Tax=Seonamhaeicola marinus TaxID=1912246 RepID=A0A5D0HNP8_9FLAO|nr:YbbR-like domain-containing protein [Seonamhaeicola marinus]
MGKITSKIGASLKNKRVNVFFLFLLFSFVILIFSKLSKDYTNTLAFQIEKLNVPEEQVILNDSTTIDITLKTHGFRWFNYYFNTPKISVDFTKDVSKKDKMYIWSQSKDYLKNTQFDKEVQILNVSPDTLLFRYDSNMVKKVPVTLDADIKFSAGYNVFGAMKLEPDSVTVIGPHVLVKEIKEIETEKLSLEEIRTDIEEPISIILPENSIDLKFSAKTIMVKAEVKKFTEGTLKVPVEVINIPKNINLKYFPKEVNVAYFVSLDNFNTVNAEDFKVICNYKNVTGNQTFLVPELVKYPDKVKSAKINHQQIEFIIIK